MCLIVIKHTVINNMHTVEIVMLQLYLTFIVSGSYPGNPESPDCPNPEHLPITSVILI